MNESSIRKYAKLMGELGLTGLEVTEDGAMLRLERNVTAAPAGVPAAVSAPESEDDGDCVTVRSPMVGVFYAAPAEDAEPFVSVGDRIRQGQTLCIIEAMKLMNEIPAECAGEVTEVCAKNGQAVDYGCALFRIRR